MMQEVEVSGEHDIAAVGGGMKVDGSIHFLPKISGSYYFWRELVDQSANGDGQTHNLPKKINTQTCQQCSLLRTGQSVAFTIYHGCPVLAIYRFL